MRRCCHWRRRDARDQRAAQDALRNIPQGQETDASAPCISRTATPDRQAHQARDNNYDTNGLCTGNGLLCEPGRANPLPAGRADGF